MTRLDTTERISVLGAGHMGAAIGRAFKKNGFAVTVWNRSLSRTDSLRAEGIDVATSAAAAVASSPLVIMCLSDSRAVEQVLSDPELREAIRGRTLLQLTNGTSADADRSAAWAREFGAAHLCGTILSLPALVGSRDATIVYCGSKSAFDEFADSLSTLSCTDFIGEDVAQIGVLTAALECFAITALAGFLQGTALAQASRLNLRQYLSASLACLPTVVAAMNATPERVSLGNYDGDQASVDVLLQSAHLMTDVCARAGVRLELVQAVLKYFELAASQGPRREFQAAVEVIRNAHIMEQNPADPHRVPDGRC